MPQDLHARLVDSNPSNDGQRRIKQFLLQNLAGLRSLSLDEIAAETQTSQPTVTRFVKRLGYENSLDFRAACATHQLEGRLTAAEVQKTAELIWSKSSLRLYGLANLTKSTAQLLAKLSSRPDPQVQDSNVAPSQGYNDVFLIVALKELPPDFDLASMILEARETNSKIVILKATDIVVEGATEDVLQLSLHLDPQLGRTPLGVYLLSAVADIWLCGKKLNQL
jgi:hypothetical protein